MAMLEDIGTYMQINSLGTVGTDLFLGLMPDEPDNCTALFEYAGSPPDLHWQGEYPGLQVRVRNSSYQAGRAVIESIYDLLHGIFDTDLSGTKYLLIKAQGSPEVLKRDHNNRIEWFNNFAIIKERE
jgi:hypothetical protein